MNPIPFLKRRKNSSGSKSDDNKVVTDTGKAVVDPKQSIGVEAVKKTADINSDLFIASSNKVRGKAARNVLVRPHITEKASLLAATNNSYIFVVDRDATKPIIKRAIKDRYRVDVTAVRVISIPARVNRKGGRATRKRQAFKKAVISIKKGQEIKEISV